MALRRSKIESAFTSPPHGSGAASRSPPPPLSSLLLPQAPPTHVNVRGLTCWLGVVLLVFLISIPGVYSAEGKGTIARNCRHDLISVAAFSCLQPNDALRPPSLTCCKALLYAVDYDPASSQSGACCLCRYMREKESRRGLATAYVLCKGQDRYAVKKWSSFPMSICSPECRKKRNSSPDIGISAHDDHPLEHSNAGKAKNIFHIVCAIVVFFALMGLTSLWYLWRFKLAANASKRGGRLSANSGRKADRRRSPGQSSTKLKGRKF